MNKIENSQILVLSSTFPRWIDDDEPPFVYELTTRLTTVFQCTVLAPHAPRAKKSEFLGSINVKRYQYLPENLQTLAYDGGILPKLKNNRIYYIQIPFFLLAQLSSTIQLIKNNSFIMIHAHWLIPQGLIAVLACKLLRKNIPVLCTLHGSDLHNLKGKLFTKLKKYTLKHTHAITVVSNAMKNELVESNIDSSKIKVIPMGADLTETFIPLPCSDKIPSSVLFVGRLIEKKGVQFLLRAISNVVNNIPEIQCFIAGDGPYLKTLKELSKELRIEKKVNFLGKIDNKKLPILFNQCSLVVFPSTEEGFGIVLVEALGCECPVVTSDIPSIHDIVTHNKTALITKTQDPLEIARAIKKLLLDSEFGIQLGKEGRRHVLKEFDWDIISKRYINYIKSITNY